jgi:hypothetical protein
MSTPLVTKAEADVDARYSELRKQIARNAKEAE